MEIRMIYQTVVAAFEMIDIDTEALTSDAELETDLGIDSQELIELECALEKLLKTSLPANFIKKTDTPSKIAEKLTPYFVAAE